MHSRHIASRTPAYAGLSCAVDVAHLTPSSGKIDWAPGQEAKVFGAISEEVKAAANRLGIPIIWGGDWHSFKDWGHFELPWAKYP